jgi:hypothetical protein
MAASSKDKRTPITTPPYQVPSVDATSDQPIFSLVTTFKQIFEIIFKINKKATQIYISVIGLKMGSKMI